MAYAKDPRVDSYIDPLPEWQQDGGIAPDPEGIITDGHGNSSGRQIKIREGEPINEAALLALLRAIIADNRAGGWRKIKAERGES